MAGGPLSSCPPSRYQRGKADIKRKYETIDLTEDNDAPAEAAHPRRPRLNDGDQSSSQSQHSEQPPWASAYGAGSSQSYAGSDPASSQSQWQRPAGAPARDARAVPTPAPPIWLDQEEEEHAYDTIMSTMDGADESAFTYQPYGAMGTKIVGVQYYKGLASEGEYVLLNREPSNRYDANAIKVENVRRDQIGHIPRNVASKLAKYLDDGSLVVEGRLSGRIGTFDCPIQLTLLGTSDAVNSVELGAKMKSDRLPTQILNQREKEAKKRKAEELKRIAAEQKAQAKRAKGGAQYQGPGPFTNLASSQGYDIPTQSYEEIMNGAETVNPREMGKVVEKFGLDEDTLAAMAMADAPAKLATTMLPYQRQALHWLLQMENPCLPPVSSAESVQLWQRSRVHKDTFTNVATGFSVAADKVCLSRGGVLSDDMGLGKTLEMISLIVSEDRRAGHCNTTLIVAPVGVMSNWTSQIDQHVSKNHALRVLMHHGSSKKILTPQEIDAYDVIVTSYTTLAVDYVPRSAAEPPAIPRSRGLYSVKWRRVILDEGQIIRNPKTKAAVAATNLLAQSKWALTGTPIINSLQDLYSLVRFIGLTGGLERADVFNSVLTRPIKADDATASILLQTLMASICLRRKKDMSFINLRLPKMSEYVHHVDFHPHEREKYDALQAEAQGALRDVKGGNKTNGTKPIDTYRHLFEIILRLRQTCNHWKLCGERISSLLKQLEEQKMLDLTPENKTALQGMLQVSIETQEDCAICLEPLHHPVITRCAHSFGFDCIERVIETQHRCPMCRAEPLDVETLVRPAVAMGESSNGLPVASEDAPSSKIEALLSILRASHKKNPGTKTVIFSQWTSYLDIIQAHLPSISSALVPSKTEGKARKAFKIARIDGTLTPAKRDQALQMFSSDPNCSILLASLAVCSVGLNLVVANQVVLADSWWAPAIEDQAVDRVHRLGQTREVTVWRLVVTGTIEEKVLGVQEQKRKLMGRAFDEEDEGGAAAGGSKKGKETKTKRGRGQRTRLADIERLLG